MRKLGRGNCREKSDRRHVFRNAPSQVPGFLKQVHTDSGTSRLRDDRVR